MRGHILYRQSHEFVMALHYKFHAYAYVRTNTTQAHPEDQHNVVGSLSKLLRNII